MPHPSRHAVRVLPTRAVVPSPWNNIRTMTSESREVKRRAGSQKSADKHREGTGQQRSTARIGAAAGGWLQPRPTSCHPAEPQLGERRCRASRRCAAEAGRRAERRQKAARRLRVPVESPRRPSPRARPTESARGSQICASVRGCRAPEMWAATQVRRVHRARHAPDGPGG